MKKLLFPALGALSLLAGCNFLQRDPLGSIAPQNFFQTASDAEASLTSCYDALQAAGAYRQDLVTMGEMPSDNCTSTNNDVNALEKINWTATTGQVGSVFRQAYVGINRANIVLKYVPTVTMDTARRSQILGEARFLRALNYLNLVRAYGRVPLRLQPSESGAAADINLAASTSDQVYDQIVADLQRAAIQMPGSNQRRAAKNAAYALLARTQLTRRNWAAALDAAKKVTGVALVRPFKSLYPAENKGSESLFEVQFASSGDDGAYLPDLILPSPPAVYPFAKFNIPTSELIAFADTVNDRRWAYNGPAVTASGTTFGRDHVSYVDSRLNSSNNSGPFTYKWTSTTAFLSSNDNTYVLRYAEVLLALAEASNELNGPNSDALAALNQIRDRAGLAQLSLGSSQVATKQAMRNEIDRQRRLELAFEGERWWDLVRYARHTLADPSATHTVTALDIIKQQQNTPGGANVNYLVFPLPLSELNYNPLLTQNPGY